MAAFTHLNPNGSRFSDGSYGVFYCARERQTAIAETRYHSGLFLAATNEAPLRQQMRLYTVMAHGEVVDLRGDAIAQAGLDPRILAPDDYGPGTALGRAVRAAGAPGIAYPSVRDPEGECLAALRTTHAARLPARGVSRIQLERRDDRLRVRAESGRLSGQTFHLASADRDRRLRCACARASSTPGAPPSLAGFFATLLQRLRLPRSCRSPSARRRAPCGSIPLSSLVRRASARRLRPCGSCAPPRACGASRPFRERWRARPRRS